MLQLLFLTGLCLLGASLLIASQWKRYRIRHTGTLVMAEVTQVHIWQDTPRAGFLLKVMIFGGEWWYEIRAECIDPNTEKTCIIESGIKKGFSRYQRGDHIAAYVSPYGNYLKPV